MVNERGMTLVEMIIATAAMLLLLTAAASLYLAGMKSSAGTAQAREMRNDAQYGLKAATKDLRGAKTPAGGTAAVEVADADRLVFFADANDDSLPERLEYRVVNGELIRTVQPPANTSAPWTFGAGDSSTIFKNVVNPAERPFFSYQAADGTELSPVPLGATDLADIRRVSIDVSLDDEPGKRPEAFDTATVVYLRNAE